MLTAVPKHWFSWDFTIMDGPRALAQIDVSSWREKGGITVDGAAYRVYREGVMSGDFVLESRGSVVARAEKPSAWRGEFVVKYKDHHYTLRAKSAFRRTFVLMKGPAEIGSIARKSAFTRKAAIDLPDDLPLPVSVFTVWLAMILWKRDAAAAAS